MLGQMLTGWFALPTSDAASRTTTTRVLLCPIRQQYKFSEGDDEDAFLRDFDGELLYSFLERP